MPLRALLLLTALLPPATTLGEAPPSSRRTTFRRHAVASQSAEASAVGARILARGGNAVDAAVATAFALAVTHPAAGNIGGGGFLVVRLGDGRATCFDFRETAPRDATADMFLDRSGKYDAKIHHHSARAVGVPGSVAGLHLAHRRLGKLPWADLVQPAADLARKGFHVSRGLAASLREGLEKMRPYPASVRQFSRGGEPLHEGDLLVQADLAGTLERIRDHGPAGFYEGKTARLLAREMRRLGGIIRQEDLAQYRAVERKPVRGSYRGCEVISMPPPSSGGTVLIEMLHIIEGYDLAGKKLWTAPSTHRIAEAMRRAYADRARYLGDPDRVPMPLDRLLSPAHAARLRASIRPDQASRSKPTSFKWPAEGSQTTHISVVDGDLMCVSLTTTLEESYGSGIVVPGAGFLLNNEMGDFNPRAGLTTADGLIGTRPNLVEPGKRMLSSMTPTIVTRGGRPLLVVGSPGGRTIINTVLLVILNVLDGGMGVQEAVDHPRFHHQWLPDGIVAERGCFAPPAAEALRSMGHRLRVRTGSQGCVLAILVHPEKGLEAGVDHRRPDTAAAGE